jgi:hypothetical protein
VVAPLAVIAVVLPLQIVESTGVTVIVGVVLTVTKAVVLKPLTVYDMLAEPTETPVTTPVADMVATPEALLDHVPPAVALASGRVLPVQTGPALVILCNGLFWKMLTPLP